MLKSLMLMMGALIAIGNTYASSTVRGASLTVSGTIADTTCNIYSNNVNSNGDLTVILPAISASEVRSSGVGIVGESVSFSLSFEDCDLSQWGYATALSKTFYLTIDSSRASSDGTYIENSGNAEGVGIALKTSSGTTVSLGKPFSPDNLYLAHMFQEMCDSDIDCGITLEAYYYNYGGAIITSGSVIATATYTLNWA